MTFINARTSFESTSAAGAMLTRQIRESVLVGAMLVGFGTSAGPPLPDPFSYLQRPVLQTNSGVSLVRTERAGAAIAELRRLSGLTWEQLARLFKVSRRSLHFWASGKAMTSTNEEHLQRLLAVVRKVDRGSARVNRTELLAVRDDGTILLDLLASGQYELVVALLGHGQVPPRIVPAKLSDEEMAARAPHPPEERVGALQERIHRETGIARVAKSVKVRSGR